MKYGSILVASITGVTINSDSLVAGNDAGCAYSTFPKTNDEWIPSDYFICTTNENIHNTNPVMNSNNIKTTATNSNNNNNNKTNDEHWKLHILDVVIK